MGVLKTAESFLGTMRKRDGEGKGCQRGVRRTHWLLLVLDMEGESWEPRRWIAPRSWKWQGNRLYSPHLLPSINLSTPYSVYHFHLHHNRLVFLPSYWKKQQLYMTLVLQRLLPHSFALLCSKPFKEFVYTCSLWFHISYFHSHPLQSEELPTAPSVMVNSQSSPYLP